MIDTELIRKDPKKFVTLVNLRGNINKVDIYRWLELDSKRKDLIKKRDEINRKRNLISKNDNQHRITNRELGRKLKEELEYVQKELDVIQQEWQEMLYWIPNIFLEDVPPGTSEDENIEIKVWDGEKYMPSNKIGNKSLSAKYQKSYPIKGDIQFTPKPHWEIGTVLNLLNIDKATKTSGSRFYYLVGYGVLIVNAVFDLMFKKLLSEGFIPVIVPLLVKEKVLYGSSHFPGDKDQIYRISSDNLENPNETLYLIGSSEPSNFAYFMDTTLDYKKLPIKIMAQSSCFRSEVGSWGKDVRGIKRAHQFDKLEMNVIMEANIEKAREMHEYLLSLNEWLLQTIGIPYRVINMCIGELGYYAAAKKYDVEFWSPSQQCYIEIMSNSITTDYQARRLNIKYIDSSGKTQYAYTLNDTAVTHRILIAILEHYQQSDGSLLIPEAIRYYVGRDKITPEDTIIL
ncbi:MAG: serine--tRNA ligase [Candidatus Dojkabacteria bacterium]|nr:serine--tRNA ligase [Candidatus Dojkabacteria bacterium]